MTIAADNANYNLIPIHNNEEKLFKFTLISYLIF